MSDRENHDMQESSVLTDRDRDGSTRLKRVLNAGSGSRAARRLHPLFRGADWQEVRFDIDPLAKPDLIGSLADMSNLVENNVFDAVWASHSLEHLYIHEVGSALKEFRRILSPGGFALITSPDIETVAALVVKHGLDHVAYQSPMGPITCRDMIFGHADSIRRGMVSMAHKTGFTCAALGSLLLEAGFPVVLAKRQEFDVWALAFMEHADRPAIQRNLSETGLNMFEDEN
jgi:predicted SAM-dependent methyltransferase